MSTAKHTPGPWHVASGCQIRSAKDQIAKAWMMRNGEGLANAHLLAAAPELLEALELMIDTHDEGGWPTASITIARAVITKAKGES